VDEVLGAVSRRTHVLLIRHGVTGYVHREGWVDAAGIQRWRDAMDATGILETSRPPRVLVDRVAQADLVMASDLARAVESAKRLAPGRDVMISPLFRESALEFPKWMRFRWPVRIWRIFTGSQWMYRILRGTDVSESERARAAAAAKLLGELAQEHELIAVVCHGVFRRMLSRHLARAGWSPDPGRHSYRNWSVWEYVAPARAARP
jgi:broad specificity phosphatase PhoE